MFTSTFRGLEKMNTHYGQYKKKSQIPTSDVYIADFTNNILLGACDKLQHQNTELSRPLGMVHNSLQYMNMPIQLLGNVLPNGTTKFSVKGIESYSIVNFSIYQNKMFVKCMDGLCTVQLANLKKFAKTLSIQVANDAKYKEREKLLSYKYNL